MEHEVDLGAVRASHARLLATVADLDDATARRPSKLPGWTIGHLVTHLARNADSHTQICEGAAAGEVRDQYSGGPRRDADIEAGAGRPAVELVDDLRTACARVERAFDAVTDWDAPCRLSAGEFTLRHLPRARRREVEIHRTDLGLDGATWHDWDLGFVDGELAALTPDQRRQLVAHLAGRTDEAPWLYR